MGTLAYYLQRAFREQCPAGWACRGEERLLPLELERVMGYAPRADVILERGDGRARIWIEFEVSRADPVANHAKFATAHLFQPQADRDVFVAMVSPHVARGRRNLAANMTAVMRAIGMRAFQTVLLPACTPDEIKRLNHLPASELAATMLPIDDEIDRAIAVSQPLAAAGTQRIHFAGDLTEVLLNLLRWNQDLTTPEGQALWKQRNVTYFVYDPRSGLFAPSKFCAFVVLSPERSAEGGLEPSRSVMRVEFYVTFGEAEPCFDGNRARVHLVKRLGMLQRTSAEEPDVAARFDHWFANHSAQISVNAKKGGPIFLLPPAWFL